MLPTEDYFSPDVAYRELVQETNSLLALVRDVRFRVLGEGCPAERLVNLHTKLKRARQFGQTINAVPGISDYAKTAFNDPNYDLVAEYVAVLDAGDLVTDWIEQNVPHAGKFYAGFVFDSTVERFSRATIQDTSLVTLLDDLIAAITG